MRYLLKNALIATPVSTKKGSVAIDGEKIAGIWYKRLQEMFNSANEWRVSNEGVL